MSQSKSIRFQPQDVSQLRCQSNSGATFIIMPEPHLPNQAGAEHLNFSGIFPRESAVSQGNESPVSSSQIENLENSQNSFSTGCIFYADSQGYSQETQEMLPTVSYSDMDDRPLTFTGLFKRVCSEEHEIEGSGTNTQNDNQPKSTRRVKRLILADDNGRSELKKPVKRPGLSYSKLIMDVLLEGGKMTVQQIFKCIQDKYPNHFNMKEKRWKACIRNCLTQKDQFIRETSKLTGNYWKLSDDLLRKLRPPDNTSQGESLEIASVDRSTWNSGRYVTIAPKRAYSDSSLDGVLNKGASCLADVSNDSYSTPLKSSVLANNCECFLEDRNLLKSEGEISRISDHLTSCHSLDAILTRGASFVTDISNDSQITPLKSSVIGGNNHCFAEDRNLLNSNLNMRGETTSSCSDRIVTPMESNIIDTSKLSYNTPLKLSLIGNNRQCFSEDRNLLTSNLAVKVERNEILDYSKSCNHPNLKRASDVLNDENRTPVSRKRSRFARKRISKMHGFRDRLDPEKNFASPEEKLADRNVPCQFSNVNENVESSSEELRGFKISSVSGKRFSTKIQNQFAKSGHQFKDVTNVLRSPSSMEKGRRNGSVASNGENIENQKRQSFLFRKIGKVHSLGSCVSSKEHSKLRSFSTSLFNAGDRHNHGRGSNEAEASAVVGTFDLPINDKNTVTALSEIPKTTGEATIRSITTEVSSSETLPVIKSFSLDYDNGNSRESLNECFSDGKGETVGYATTTVTLNDKRSTTPHGDDRSCREELTEFSDDEFFETTGEVTNAESPNSDDIGRDEVFAELSNPPELGDTWDNVDLSFLDNLDDDG